MRVLLTGRPGVGKSFVTQALSKQGLQAYDLEEVAHAIGLEYKATGKPAEWPKGFVDWGVYAWNMRPAVITALLESKHGNVVVSGSANNQTDYYSLFDKIIVLTLDSPDTLRHRLETRQVHEFGQDQANIDRAVERFTAKQDELLSHGGIAINNERPIDQVVADILRAIA